MDEADFRIIATDMAHKAHRAHLTRLQMYNLDLTDLHERQCANMSNRERLAHTAQTLGLIQWSSILFCCFFPFYMDKLNMNDSGRLI